ncbi:MAG TPA: AAA family ATPase [Thermoguttaceae bacterium]|nr:AAA family ATPase [Thermoguttaceae bacterium]
MSRSIGVIALTGGPGGGKSELLRAIADEGELAPRVAACEEAIHGMRFVRLSPRSAEFQCALVATQAATEATLLRALAHTQVRAILAHRGTLDPCAFWQSFGNSRQSFFEMTGTTREDHYRRYDLVIHLESAAVRVPEAYLRYPLAHRPEQTAEAARLDQCLGELWSGHPHYVKIDGTDDLAEKLSRGLALVRQLLASGCITT